MKEFEKHKDELILYYNQGLSSRQVCIFFNVHHSTISSWFRKLGLKNRFSQPINMMNEHEAKCSKCLKIKPINEFQFNRKNSIGEYKFSYCNDCRKKQGYLNINSSLEKFLKQRYNKLKLRALKENIRFNLNLNDVIEIYNKQEGLCFYSDILMNIDVGKGIRSTALSFDKIIPTNGYIKGNVVLTTNRFNMIKHDLSLEEMKLYTPLFYKRIIECEWLNIKFV